MSPYGKGRIGDRRPPMPPHILALLERPYRGHTPDADFHDLYMDERASTQDGTLGPLGEVTE